MATIFPSIQPDTELRSRKPFQVSVRGADGSRTVSVPHPFLQHFFRLEWTSIVDTDLDLVIAHFKVNRANAFPYFEFTPRAISDLQIAVGDGGAVFELLSKLTSDTVYKVGGVTTAATFSAGSGSNGRDRITFAVAPDIGASITYSASGRTTQCFHSLWYSDVDRLDETPVEANLYRLVVDLEEAMP
ncbi:MAG: hypothetical protein JWO56_3757 [Acidobacteria bacterium]|nr:hypothetical protein [Acidobacteriota bacterium]